MCKVKKMSPLWGFLLSFPLWTVSCVDNKYDLDKDIGGSGFSRLVSFLLSV